MAGGLGSLTAATGSELSQGAAAETVRADAKARPTVTFTGGPSLVIDVDPNLSGSKYWRFRLDRRSGSKWKKVGVYHTHGKAETRSLRVKAGTYRVHVYARSGFRSSTTGAYAFSPASGWWAPAQGTDWQWQLSGTVDTGVSSPVFDIDGEDNSAATVATLHAKGARVICYFSAGSYEKGRGDAAKFPSSVRGKALEGWPDEQWLDIRKQSVLLPIMEKRIASCGKKGFDAVEPDNVDGYSNSTGFSLSSSNQRSYNKAIARLAHKYGMGVALKNDPAQASSLQPYFDFAVVEECARFGECSSYTPFTQAGKAVLHVEYEGDLASFCPATKPLGFSSMLKNLDLDAWRSVCP